MGPPAAASKYCLAIATQIDQSGSHLSGLPNNILQTQIFAEVRDIKKPHLLGEVLDYLDVTLSFTFSHNITKLSYVGLCSSSVI